MSQTSQSQTCVATLYASVIEDVIGGVREFFMDEGVDEQVLLELRHSWELKLKTTKAVEVPKPEPDPQPPTINSASQQASSKFVSSSANSQTTSEASNTNKHSNNTVCLHLSVPINSAANQSEYKHMTIDVPKAAFADNFNQLHSVFSGPILSAAMALPPDITSNIIQPHATAALQGHNSIISQAVQAMQTTLANGTPADVTQRQTYTHQGGVPQVDGVRDSSDEDDNEDDDNDDDDDIEDDDKEDEEDPDAAESPAIEEDPLNSDDDVSEDDPTEMFETDNVVVCQYDKITRSRNKWKFHLKDGIMNLGGKDFVFQRSSGDAEW